MPNYKSPPIVEAVIGLSFAERYKFERLEKSIPKFKKNYSRVEEQKEINVDVSNGGVLNRTDVRSGFRFTSKDNLDILLLKEREVTFARLAPYCGWEKFVSNFERDFTVFIDAFGFPRLSRIGVRFINRIDIDEVPAVPEKYLNIRPQIPDIQDAQGRMYSLSTVITLAQERFNANINSGTVDSPVPDHISFLLDLDVYTERDLPQRPDKLFELLGEMRVVKNDLFELLITEEARRTFD